MLLLLACTETFVPLPGLSEGELLVLTEPDPADVLGERAAVVDDVAAGLAQGETAFASRVGWGEYPVITAEEGVRIVSRERGVRLLVWVDREGLADVMPRTTWVDVDGEEAAAEAPGVRVPAGMGVGVDADGVRLEIDTRLARRTLPLSEALVDQVWSAYTDDDARAGAAPAEDERLPFVGVEGGASLRDDAGRTLLTLEPGYGLIAFGRLLREEPARGRYVYIGIGADGICGRGPTLWARGWVWPADTDARTLSGFGGGCSMCGGGFGMIGGDRVDVPTGALLYDAPDGTAVGITEEDVALERGPDDGAMPGWRAVQAPLRAGEGQLWARAEGEGVPRPDEFAPIEVREVDR